MFQETEEETFLNLFYEASNTLIEKPYKRSSKTKIQTNIFHEYRCNFP